MSFELSKSQLVDLVLGLDTAIGALEGQLKELKKKQEDAERQLIEAMEADEESAFVDEQGRKVSRDDKMFLSIRNEEKPEWFEWLHEIHRPDLIRTDVNKNSLNAVIKKIIRGELAQALPEVFNMQKDLFFKPHVKVTQGQKSLRKAASEAYKGED